MTRISSYVFFDIETTGLPWQEKNRTKIIELSFVAAERKDIESTPFSCMPPVNKLTFVLNPKKNIHRAVTKLTGLSNKVLRNAPVFKEKIHAILAYLHKLPKPVCLVAHNGNIFDFKILLAECNDANISLPDDILCVDSLIGFRRLLKGTSICYNTLLASSINMLNSDNVLTDDDDDNDDDEWPDLNVSTEEWQEIDDLCLPLFDISFDESSDAEQSDEDLELHENKDYTEQVMQIVFKRQQLSSKKSDSSVDKVGKGNNVQSTNSKPELVSDCYKLSALYKRLLNKEEINAHRAEVDCLMLLECVVALKYDFLPWADSAYRNLSDIKPLIRY